ncbi:SLAM family member 9 [Amia ocellicauda]|uniref:SLAM family member 9 n=1 Tax=Amia ocellicauda TaxID=2972642 RepID=UPI003464211C
MTFLPVLPLLMSLLVTGISTEEGSKMKILNEIQGMILHLTVDLPMKNENVEQFTWTFARTENGKVENEVNVVRNINTKPVYPHYINRTYFNHGDWSITLTNLTQKDTGIYKATAEYPNGGKHVLSHYSVTVHEALLPPQLEVTSNFSTNATCHLTLNCSVHWGVSAEHDCELNLHSARQWCSASHNRSSQEENIQFSLYFSHNLSEIVCNVSNQVSSKTGSILVEKVCPVTKRGNPKDKENQAKSTIFLIPGILVFVIFVAISMILTHICFKRRKNDERYFTVTPHDPPGQQTPEESRSGVCTVYDTVRLERISTESLSQASTQPPSATDTLYSVSLQPCPLGVGMSYAPTVWPPTVGTLWP